MTKARKTTYIDWSEYFLYDESSPSSLVWRVSRANNRIKAGQRAGSLRKNSDTLSYWTVEVNSRSYMVHRVIWEMHNGRLNPEDNIDHENGDGTCNNISNLLCKTHQENCQNKKKQCDNTSGVTGVHQCTKTDKKGSSRSYWVAAWSEGKVLKSKCFSIDKLGKELAFSLAVELRTRMIGMLNINGMTYSATHGCR
jgi:hypothetical protein